MKYSTTLLIFFFTTLVSSSEVYKELAKRTDIYDSQDQTVRIFRGFGYICQAILTHIRKNNNISTILVDIVPKKNVANDPLNVHVDGLSLASYLEPYVKTYIEKEMTNYDYTSNATNLAKHLVEHGLSTPLNEMVISRLGKLRNMQYERELNSVDTIRQSLMQFLAQLPHDQFDDFYNQFLHHIKENLDSPDVKRVLTFPVVEEEMHRAYQNHNFDDHSLTDDIALVLDPFLREAVHNEDANAISLQSNVTSVVAIVEKILPILDIAIQNGLQVARNLEKVIGDEMNTGKIFELVHDEYVKGLRHAISFELLKTPSELKDRSVRPHDFIKTFNFKFFTRESKYGANTILLNEIRKKIGSQHYALMQSFDQVLITHTIPDIYQRWINKNTFLQEYESYFDSQNRFTNQHKIAVADFVRKQLTSEYKNLSQNDFSLNSTAKLKRYTLDPFKLSIKSTMVKDFLNMLDTHVVKSCGFLPEMFLYSRSYFDVMSDVYPSLSNPFKDFSEISPRKDEL